MRMQLESANGWRLRDAPFPLQQTYATPLAELPRFVATLLSPFRFDSATLRIETIVFKPEDLMAFLKCHGIEANEEELNRATLIATSAEQAAELLRQVLAQWIDFAFFPSANTFAIYADHDEYTTIFTSNDELLSQVRDAMRAQNFKAVNDWQRTGPHSPGKIEQTHV